ncbi:hypothetical protein MTO96_035527 [Rhipicephalus appendiculatus]
MEVPADRLSDFIFYDSLGDAFDRLGQPARGPFKEFQTLADNEINTEYGVSIFPLFATSCSIPCWTTAPSWRTT